LTSITLTPRAEREQRAFRALLNCMSRPGTIGRLPLQPHAGDWGAAISALEALVDHEVTFCVWPERTELSDIVLRQTGSRLASLEDADYVLCDSERLAETLRRSKDGTLEYPDRGATIVCLVQGLSSTETAGTALLMAGPGIKDSACVWVDGIDAAACRAFVERNAGTPLGADVVLVTRNGAVCCLTRYTRLELESVPSSDGTSGPPSEGAWGSSPTSMQKETV
jgi:alpha-D-ribose 1-methylphosphonate 5-triphosphate synthase subunit PhnH